MFRKFINALKTSRTARYALIAILILTVLLCIAAASIGIPVIVVIILMLVVGFPVIIAVGGVGAAIGIAGSAISNKKSYDEISRNDPTLAELEKERGKLQMYNIIFIVAAVILALVALVISQAIGFYAVLILAILFYFIKIFPMNIAFNNSFGERVITGEINRRFANAVYDAKKGFDAEEVEPISFVGHDTYSGCEYIEGESGPVHFRSCRLYYEIVSNVLDETNESHESRATVFSGYLYSIPLSKQVPATVYVADKKLHTDLKDKITTGQDTFDADMKVYSTDPTSVGSVLTGQVADRILRLKETSNKPFCLVFRENKLYAFVRDKDESCFRVSLAKDINVMELKDRVSAHLAEQADFLNGLANVADSMI